MSNYVQTRVAPTSKSGVSIAHDLRLKKPNYLRDDMFHNQFKNIYSNTNAKQLRAEIKTYENEFRKRYKERLGRNPQKGKASAFMEGVITLSNSINEMLKKEEVSYEELNELFVNALNNQLDKIEEITGTRPVLIEYSIHYDEKTPHLHYLTTNYDLQGRSLHHNLKTSKKIAELQDQVGEDFKPIGFERGEKKGFIKKLSIAQMHEEEIKGLEIVKEKLEEDVEELETTKTEIKELETTKKELLAEVKTLQNEKKELKGMIENKTTLKKELDKLDKDIKFKREEVKEVKSELVIKKEEEKLLNANMSDLKNEKELLENENNILQEENDLLQVANEEEIYVADKNIETLQEVLKAVNKFKNPNEAKEDDWRSKLNTIPEDKPTPRKYK
mgnify:CR=1 FL=1